MAGETSLDTRFVFQGVCSRRMSREELTEREILELVRKGDREAYQGIVTRYMHSAYYIALGFVHNQQDALDISQEAFIRAFRKLRKFDLNRRFFPWFYKLLKNLCLDHIKRRRRLSEIPLEGIQVPTEDTEDREMKEILWRGIEKLSFEQKEIIILRYFRQYSYQEIAEMTGKPIGTVMSTLYYAKRKLKEVLTIHFRPDNGATGVSHGAR